MNTFDNQTYKTTDGGVSWNVIDSKKFVYINFPSENVGYALSGETNDIGTYKTTDGGESWNVVNAENYNRLNKSLNRMSMPEIDKDLFFIGIKEL